MANETTCPYCSRKFNCINRHLWRCKKTTVHSNNNNSNLSNTNNLIPPINSTNDFNSVHDNLDNLLQCCCGKFCKGRKGLIMHKRSCKTSKSLNFQPSVVNKTTFTSATTINNIQQSSPSSSPAEVPTTASTKPLPGVKLPRSPLEWEVANAYFHSELNSWSVIDDINKFATQFHNIIYKYFATTYGTIKPKRNSLTVQDRSINRLKKDLASLKKTAKNNNDQQINNEIIRISKLIRAKLRSNKINRKNDKAHQLKINFWKTCNNIFSPTNPVSPLFNVDTGHTFFKNTVNNNNTNTFCTPDWIPPLPIPSHNCNTDPPTYKELVSAIHKIKSRSSPCPLDQISIIIFKKCPILRTFLHKLIVKCWSSSSIPSCWRQGLTVLIYKKGDAQDPANFRPITLQPIPYKIFSAIIKNRLYRFLESNKYFNRNIQKGFYPSIDGLSEHTQMLTHLLNDAKRHQRTIIVTLLDLRNAFGEVNHNLIELMLIHHHVPSPITNLIRSIYSNYHIMVSINGELTPAIQIKKGVLQGDPCSPILFNMCFNPLMRVLDCQEYRQCGYMWGPSADLKSRSWLQFADDSAIIAHSSEGAQKLINLNQAWCKWSGMEMRIDKCISYGMRKSNGNYEQFMPRLTIDDVAIPRVAIGDGFEYLGKVYDFGCTNNKLKNKLLAKLIDMLKTTTDLNVRPQQKLHILRKYIPCQLRFDLRSSDISLTWISNNLDNKIIEAVRNWLSIPISGCVAEILSLPIRLGGHNIKSLKDSTETMRLKLRNYLKTNTNDEIRCLYRESSSNYIKIDNALNSADSLKAAKIDIENKRMGTYCSHVEALQGQGLLIKSIKKHITASQVCRWSKSLENLSASLYKFTRKYLIQQLPTNSNLFRWGKIKSQLCPLCQANQTNKHVLSNCSSVAALDRYTKRHNKILTLIVNSLKLDKRQDCAIYADIKIDEIHPISIVFESLRPDIAIIYGDTIEVLEITVCHETNLAQSKAYKINKYEENLKANLKDNFKHYNLIINTFEISPIGLFNKFNLNSINISWTDSFIKNLILTAVASSYNIYCERNNM